MAASCEGSRACRSCSKSRWVAQRKLSVVPCDRRGGRWMLWSTSGGGDPILPLRCYPETYSRKSTRTSDIGAWARVLSALCN